MLNIRASIFSLVILLALAIISSAATYTWTGLGVANDIDDVDNWTWDGVVALSAAPASGVKIGTGPSTVGGAADTIVFDSDSATLPTINIEAVRIASNGTQLPNFVLSNGTLNFNRAEVWSHAGTTFTIGDGDMTTSATANFIATVNLARLEDDIDYVINTDGLLNIDANYNISASNVNLGLFGGTIDATGASISSGLFSDTTNFVSFNHVDSTFISALGGEFTDATAVQDEFGSSFRLSAALSSAGNSLQFTDIDGTNFSVTVIPEPSSLALIGIGMGAMLLRRRR